MSETLKSKIISAPAGSGKTERLAERYIELLKYAEPERILTITFTDKAAAEMKERIFKILKERDPVKYNLIKEKSLQLRIQTIDSFCFSLLRRFAHLIGYQPDLEVLTDNNYLKELSIFNTLFKIAEQEINTNDYQILINLITTNRFKGWDALRRLFDSLFQARLSPQRAKLPPIPGLERLPDLIAELEQDPITKERIPNFQFQIPKTSEEAEQLKAKITDIEPIFLTITNKTPKKQCETPLQHQWNCKMAEYRKIIFNLTSNFRFEKTFRLFTNRFLKEFEELKKSLNQVDFADLEILTYHILTTHPEWSNILYLFDEHTDHILVDEFQDTSFLQWAIIAKLVEEWLSGEGAKRARGVKPTIFLVGDEKQSIYLFRNAHPEIFTRAKKQLSERLPKDEFEYIEIKENFRSLKAIIDFTNHIFPKLMNPSTDSPGWMTRYQEFQCQRNNPNPGIVEIILSSLKGNMLEARAKDAELVAKKILSIINKPIVYDQDEKPRPARYEDITILLRTRTHLTAYENALREHQIPFIVVKGIGFYDTIEITLLRAIFNFLVDPNDSFSAYLLLKSPLFNLSEKEILLISQTQPEADHLSLWQRFIAYSSNNTHYQPIIDKLNSYLAMVGLKPMSQLIENMLDELDAWRIFWETPRYVNIKKFLRIVEQLEAEGLPPLLIANYFEKSSSKDEPKANVNTEGRNEVKIMTVHAAKGLQFPIVFVVGLDQQLTHRGSQEDILVINEQDEDTVYVLYEPDGELRRQSAIFQEKKMKEEEEEKRIFYVAVTRARDALFLTGIDQPTKKPTDKPKASQLKWLKDYLPIKFDEQQQLYTTDTKIDGLSIISENQLSAEVQQLPTTTVSEEKPKKELLLSPLAEEPTLIWRAVSKEIPEIYQEIRRKHGEDWITLGDILHQLFEKIADDRIKFELETLQSEAIRLFNIYNIPKVNQQRLLEEIERQFQIISNSQIAEIIKPQPNSFAELPFVLKQGQIIYSGRIDRIIIKNNTINLYDYKTFPVSKAEMAIYQEKYQAQLAIYKKAASKIFNMPKVLGYLIFTADGSIVPI